MTFTVAASGDDGYLVLNSPTYPPTGTTQLNEFPTVVGTSHQFTGSVYQIATGLIRWDTSALPDNSVIQSATFRCYDGGFQANADGKSLTADWYDNWPIDAADWSAVPQRSALANAPLTNFSANTYNTVALSNTNGISTTSYTALRLHLTDGAPTGFNLFTCASFDEGVHTPPQLIVTYTTDSGGGSYLPPSPPPAQPTTVSPSPTPAVPVPPTTPPSPSRDLTLFGRLPSSGEDWRTLHVIAYGAQAF